MSVTATPLALLYLLKLYYIGRKKPLNQVTALPCFTYVIFSHSLNLSESESSWSLMFKMQMTEIQSS